MYTLHLETQQHLKKEILDEMTTEMGNFPNLFPFLECGGLIHKNTQGKDANWCKMAVNDNTKESPSVLHVK